MAALVCDKDELLKAYPCLKCVSETETLALIAVALCKINAADANADCSPGTLLSNAACLTCMSEKQMLQAFAALIINSAADSGYIEWGDDLTAEIACMLCLTPRQLLAIILNLICEGIASGALICTRLQ